MSQEKRFIFVVLLFVVSVSLSCSFPFVLVGTWPDGCPVGRGLVVRVVGECFVVFYVFSFQPAVCVGTLNLIASIPGPSILTFLASKVEHYEQRFFTADVWFSGTR